jgi:hypothetical protein
MHSWENEGNLAHDFKQIYEFSKRDALTHSSTRNVTSRHVMTCLRKPVRVGRSRQRDS